MQYSLTLLALVASVSAQTAPQTAPAQGLSCSNNFVGTFEFSTVNASTYVPGAATLPQCTSNPIITLSSGTLTDQENRQAEVVANHQFQFDPKDKLQSGRLYDTGFEVCTNTSDSADIRVAHGGNTTFYSCNSGDFSNLYDDNIDGKCVEVYFQVLACGSQSHPDTSGGTTGTASVSAATSSAASSSSSTSSTVASTPSTSAVVSTQPVASPSTVAPVAPYPTGNATVPAASGTGSPSSTAPGHSTSSPVTAPASGAEALAIGSKFGVVAAALIAFAVL